MIFAGGSSCGVYCYGINYSQTRVSPGLHFSIARSFGYTHLGHLWNIFQDHTINVSLRIVTQIKLHGTGDYMVFLFQFLSFFYSYFFP